jgi:hypothetical protein
MRHFGKLLVAAVGALSLASASGATGLAQDHHLILHFDSMTPVTGTAVGVTNDRHLKGGGLPWVITSGSGSVDVNGHVAVTVTGLVLPAFGNTNPVSNFKAIVSCKTERDIVVNVSTIAPLANGHGDWSVNDTVTLPRVCAHPILFVTSPGGAWFAMSNPGDGE